LVKFYNPVGISTGWEVDPTGGEVTIVARQNFDRSNNAFELDLHGCSMEEGRTVAGHRIRECFRYGIEELRIIYGSEDLAAFHDNIHCLLPQLACIARKAIDAPPAESWLNQHIGQVAWHDKTSGARSRAMSQNAEPFCEKHRSLRISRKQRWPRWPRG
jgi:hypothetical protein